MLRCADCSRQLTDKLAADRAVPRRQRRTCAFVFAFRLVAVARAEVAVRLGLEQPVVLRADERYGHVLRGFVFVRVSADKRLGHSVVLVDVFI